MSASETDLAAGRAAYEQYVAVGGGTGFAPEWEDLDDFAASEWVSIGAAARSVVAAHPTGPDQDQPAAWRIEYHDGSGLTTDVVGIAKSARGHAEVVPLWRHRAREAQATAPAADEDADA